MDGVRTAAGTTAGTEESRMEELLGRHGLSIQNTGDNERFWVEAARQLYSGRSFKTLKGFRQCLIPNLQFLRSELDNLGRLKEWKPFDFDLNRDPFDTLGPFHVMECLESLARGGVIEFTKEGSRVVLEAPDRESLDRLLTFLERSWQRHLVADSMCRVGYSALVEPVVRSIAWGAFGVLPVVGVSEEGLVLADAFGIDTDRCLDELNSTTQRLRIEGEFDIVLVGEKLKPCRKSFVFTYEEIDEGFESLRLLRSCKASLERGSGMEELTHSISIDSVLTGGAPVVP